MRLCVCWVHLNALLVITIFLLVTWAEDSSDGSLCMAQCEAQQLVAAMPKVVCNAAVAQGNWSTSCNASVCREHCSALSYVEGVLPSIPEDLSVVPHEAQYRLGWDMSNPGTYAVVYVIQKQEHDGNWKYFNDTRYTNFNIDSTDQCSQFRVAAVNSYGSLGYSSQGPMPGFVENIHFSNNFRLVKEEFVAFITWDAPIGWNSSGLQYKWQKQTDRKCKTIGQHSVNAFLDEVDGQDNLIQFRISKNAFGCNITAQVQAISKCDITGPKTNFIVYLNDCTAIDGYTCPVVIKKYVVPLDSVVIMHMHGMTYKIQWQPPPDSKGMIGRYVVRWGLKQDFILLPGVIIDRMTAMIKNVSGSAHEATIEITGHAKNYGLQIIPVANGQELKDENIIQAIAFSEKLIEANFTTAAFNFSTTAETSSFKPDPKNLRITTDVPTPAIFVHILNDTSNSPVNSAKDNSSRDMYIYIGVAIPLVIFVIATIVGIKVRKHQKFRYLERRQSTEDPDNTVNFYNNIRIQRPSQDMLSSIQTPPVVPDKWELPHSCLKFGQLLGSGAFGQVMKASISRNLLLYRGVHCPPAYAGEEAEVTVAIKMLLERTENNYKQDFLQEISLMKEIGFHSNIVSMLGCCTLVDPICLIVEHIPNGDLLAYIRKMRHSLQEGDGPSNYYENHDVNILTPLDLLSFARQIAMGMEFLSQRGYVHRDLAARNVLVCEKKVVKIGDFGLARYIYDDKVYVNRKGGRLPLKWMSIEAIFDLTFSTSSDVWSFGIVLFEIVTLGGTPYPTIANKDLMRELRSGYRMEKPDNCSDELNSLMQKCWQERCSDRPSFTWLRTELEKMIEESSGMDYLDFSLDANKDYYSIQTSDTRETSSTDSIPLDHVRYQATLGHSRVAEPQQVNTEEEVHHNSASSSNQDSDDVFIQKPEIQEQLDYQKRTVKNFMNIASSIPKANHFADSSMFLSPIGCPRNDSDSSHTSTDILLSPDHLRSDTMESDVSSSSGECLLSVRGANMSVHNSNSGFESSSHDFHEVIIEDTKL